MHPKLAMSVSDLSFSAPQQGVQGDTFGSSPPGAYSGAPQVAGTTHHTSTPHGGGGIAGTTAGGAGGLAGGGGGAGGGGRTLPFTGFAAGIAAALGSALVAGGSALRRRLRRG